MEFLNTKNIISLGLLEDGIYPNKSTLSIIYLYYRIDGNLYMYRTSDEIEVNLSLLSSYDNELLYCISDVDNINDLNIIDFNSINIVSDTSTIHYEYPRKKENYIYLLIPAVNSIQSISINNIICTELFSMSGVYKHKEFDYYIYKSNTKIELEPISNIIINLTHISNKYRTFNYFKEGIRDKEYFDLNVIRVSKNEIDSIPIVDKQLIFEYDTNTIYLDNNLERVPFSTSTLKNKDLKDDIKEGFYIASNNRNEPNFNISNPYILIVSKENSKIYKTIIDRHKIYYKESSKDWIEYDISFVYNDLENIHNSITNLYESKTSKKEVNDLSNKVQALSNGVIRKNQVLNYTDGDNSIRVVYGLTKEDNGTNGKTKELGWDVLVTSENARYSWNGEEWINIGRGTYPDVKPKAYITGETDCTVTSDFIITFPIGLDIYGDDKFYKRLSKEYDFQLHNGTGEIQYDKVIDEFSATGVVGRNDNAIVIGVYFAQDVYLNGSSGTITKLNGDGTIKDVLYLSVNESSFLRNEPFSIASRSNISIDDINKTLTIGSGQTYLRTGDGKSMILNLEGSYVFNGSSELVINRNTQAVSIKDTSAQSQDKISYDDICLISFDGIKGFSDGILFNYYINSLVMNLPSIAISVAICRSAIYIDGDSVHIGKGDIYLKTTKGGTIIIINKEVIEHTFTENSYMVYNLITKTISVKTTDNIYKDDILLFVYDGNEKVCGGILYDYYSSKKALASNNYSYAVVRATTNFDVINKRAVIGSGDIYIYYSDGKASTIKNAEGTYDFSVSAELVYNRRTGSISTRDRSLGSTNRPTTDDICLIAFDGIRSFVGGVLYDSYVNERFKSYPSQTTTVTFSRAKFSITDNTATISNGDIYIKLSNGGTITIKNPTTTVYEFTQNSYLVYNILTKEKTIKLSSELNKEDIILFVYDSLAKVCAGVLYQYYINTKVRDQNFDFDADTIPSFVREETVKTYKRINEWIGNSRAIISGFITDIHAGNRDSYKHIGYLKAIDEIINFDFIINGGDIGIGLSTFTDTSEKAFNLLNNISKEHGKFKCPIIYLKGNHEQDRVDGVTMSRNILSNYLQKPSQRRNKNIYIESNQMYGYMDMHDIKLRVIFLDSNDSNSDAAVGYQYSKPQLEWLINVLNNTPNGYHILVGSHRFPDWKGDWLSNGEQPVHDGLVVNEYTLKAILSSYIHSTTGVSDPYDNLNMSWNFTGKNGKIITVISGDSHFDTDNKVNDLNLICSQGLGGISPASLPAHGVYTPFDWTSQILIDVLVVKPETGDLGVFRIGVGGEERDRFFTYII